MVRKKLITRVVWTRWGLSNFQNEVNAYFAQGWEPLVVELDSRLIKTSCMALLTFADRCDCPCSCCTGHANHDEDCKCACDCCMTHSSQTSGKSDNTKEN